MSRRSALASSFRDPAGFLFQRGNILYRQINPAGAHDYDRLMQSGLYEALTTKGLLIPHQKVDDPPATTGAHCVIQPERVPFVSYPYEWSFGQLKAAALATLRIQRIAMAHEMSLKDASAYNIQFRGGKGPILIDTLSFEAHTKGKPWIAYRQFCQHFLAPLALMSYTDVGLSALLRSHIDGIPLPTASNLLPRRTKWRPSIAMHIHLHAKSLRPAAQNGASSRSRRDISPTQAMGLLDSLERLVNKLTWDPRGTPWANYGTQTSYSAAGAQSKQQIITQWIERLDARTAWDLGANDGTISRILSQRGIHTISIDGDPAAVERNWQTAVQQQDENLLPLLNDLANPSPGLGWLHKEREPLLARGPADVAMALALVHHLAIGNNVPLDRITEFLSKAGRTLVIEFVPKNDPQVQGMLRDRQDIFPDYNARGLEQALAERFVIKDSRRIEDSTRILYLCEAHP